VIPSDIKERAEVIDTPTWLERFTDVPIGGTMVALPALNKSGLWTHAEQLFPTPIAKHFQEITLIFIAVLHLSRFPSIEALQFVAPAEWRRAFCQERLPSNRTLGEIMCLIGKNSGRVAAWKAALAERWIKETPDFDEASFTAETSLELMADRFQKYQRDNVVLDRLYNDIADLARETLEPRRWPTDISEYSKTDSTCKLAGKTYFVATGYVRGGELAKRADDSRPMRASCVDFGTTEFLSTIKLIAFRAENMIVRTLWEQIPDYETADSIMRDTFKGLADLVPNFEQRTLTVWLRQQAVRGHNDALRHLYANLNATGTLFPGTDLRLIYDMTE